MNKDVNKHKHTDQTDKAASSQQDDKVAQLQAEINRLTEALQRERADATNIRRRHDEQIAGMGNFARAAVVRELLPVIDNFERAMKHVPKDLHGNDFMKGMQGIAKQFEQALAKIGVERIATVGQPFDPQYHDAVQMKESEGEQEVVSEELQAGYLLGQEVIRPAMVVVEMV